MKLYQLINSTTGKPVLLKVQVADTFIRRLLGLMGKTLEESEGLIIKPCNSIHCFFMKIPIDVLFLDKDNTVIKKIDCMMPWAVSPIVRHAKSVIEGNAGSFREVTVGDKLFLIQ